MARHNRKGRRHYEPFLGLRIWLLKSDAWLSLRPAARAVYIQLARRYNGSNNGTLALSVRVAAKECRISKDTATQAFKDLTSAGFIELKTPGAFSRKVRHAAEWLLTEHRDDVAGEIPKRTFMRQKNSEHGPGIEP